MRLPNPFDRTDRDVRVVKHRGETLLDLRRRHFPRDMEVVVAVNGEVIDPLDLAGRKPRDGDEILLVPAIREGDVGKNVLRAVLMIAVALVAWWFIPGQFGIYAFTATGEFILTAASVATTILGGILVNALVPYQSPQIDSLAGLSHDATPTYGWMPNTTQRQGLVIPKIYGRNKLHGNIIQASIQAEEQKQTLYLLVALGEGPMSPVAAMEINGQAAASYQDVTIETRGGRLDQTSIDFFKTVKIQRSVGQTVSYGTPRTYQTDGSDFHMLEILISFPEGIWWSHPVGTFIAHKIGLKIEYKRADAGTWDVLFDDEIQEKVLASYARTFYTPELDNGYKYDVRVTKTTKDFGVYRGDDVVFTSVTEVKKDDLVYPRLALAGVKALATDQLSGRFDFSGIVSGKYIRAYDGSAWHIIDSNNPAWVAWDILTQPVISGGHKITLDDCGDENPAGDWAVSGDAVAPVASEKFVHQGKYALKLGIDADKHAGDYASFISTRNLGNLSAYSSHDLYIWVYFPTLDYVNGGSALAIGFGNDDLNFWRWFIAKSSLKAGWNCIKIDLDSPSATVGTPSWSSDIAYHRIMVYEVASNTVDFNVYMDEWKICDAMAVERYDGIDPNRLDLTAFKALADYCEEMLDDGDGEKEPRVEFNGVFDTEFALWEAVIHVLKIARAAPIWNGVELTLAVDRAASPVQLFSMGNISEAKFKESFLSASDRAAQIEVDFVNASNDFQRDKYSLFNPDVPSKSRKVTVPLFGITRPSQAWRFAQWQLALNRYINRTLEFEVDLEAIACTIGDVVRVQHDVPKWGAGGRCVSSTTNTVTLDQDVTWNETDTWKIMVRHADDSIEEKTVTGKTTDGEGRAVLTISGTWTSNPAKYDVFAYGKNDTHVKPFRVVDLSLTQDQRVKIKAIEYNATVYNADTGAPVEPTPDYTDHTKVPGVTNLSLSELQEIDGDTGTVSRIIEVSFAIPSGGYWLAARIYYRIKGNDQWVLSGETSSNRHEIPHLHPGVTYQVLVQSVGYLNLRQSMSDAPTAEITLSGADAPFQEMPDITGLQVKGGGSEFGGRDCMVEWDPITEADAFATVKLLDDCGDTHPVTNWVQAGDDALAPAENTTYVRQGQKSCALGVDASKSGNDYATWTSAASLGDLSAHNQKTLAFPLYIPTGALAYFSATDALVIRLGNDASNYWQWKVQKADLKEGWNLIDLTLEDPESTQGSPAWTAVDYRFFRVNEIAGNTQDFTLYMDAWRIVEVSAGSFKDYKIEVLTSGDAHRRWAYSAESEYRYTQGMNIEDNSGSPQRDLKFKVWARDIYNRLSASPATITASNTAPVLGGVPSVDPMVHGCLVDISGITPSDIDLYEYRVYCDTNNPPTTLRSRISHKAETFEVAGLYQNQTYYLKVVPYDLFGAGTESQVVQFQPTVIDVIVPVKGSDPDEVGELVMTEGPVEIDDCDDYTKWTSEAPDAIRVSQYGGKKEGTGSLQILIDKYGQVVAQPLYTTETAVGHNSINLYKGQRWKAPKSFNLKRIKLRGRKVGSPTDLTVYVYSDSGGSVGSLLGTVTISNLSTDVGFGWGDLSTPIAVTSGTYYWFICYVTGTPSEDYYLLYASWDDPYDGTNSYISRGSTVYLGSDLTNYDFCFFLYSDETSENKHVKLSSISPALDLTGKGSILLWVQGDTNAGNCGLQLSMGESALGEQTNALTPIPTSWGQHTWDISGIGDGSKDAIAHFGIKVTTPQDSMAYLYIDYIRAPGVEAFKAMLPTSGVKNIWPADAEKIQGKDIDTPGASEDGKYLKYDHTNSKYTHDLPGIPDAAAGDKLEFSNDTEKETTLNSYVKMKEIQVCRAGTLRIKFDLKTNYLTRKFYGQLKRNGVDVGTEQEEPGTSYQTKSQDISGWSEGDTLELWCHGTLSEGGWCRNFRIYVDYPRVEYINTLE